MKVIFTNLAKGIGSNMKCNTPIDPETKIALVDEALEAALKDLNSPRCGHELFADDMFCPACGAKVDRARLDGGFDSNGEPAPILERINGYSGKRVLVRVGYLLGGVACIGIIILGIVLMKNFRVYSLGLFLIMPLFAAIQCWRLAFNNDLARADNGDPVGLFNVGVALYKGEVKVDVLDNSVSEGESTAFDYFMRAAMKGNAQGMFNVAYCSETGVGCEQDKLRALEWYRKAAENGISEAARHAARLEREMSA